MSEKMKIAVVAGAGPAGITAGYELVDKTEIKAVVLEATDEIGGISRTICYHGNRIDIGGHRFFSKNDAIMAWWQQQLPLQGAPALDELLVSPELQRKEREGQDPEKTDRVMLKRNRVSRIFYLRSFFDYPISLSFRTLANMGCFRTLNVGFSYLYSKIFRRPDDTLENFYINRFGKALYRMFFEDYTEKVWGIHPSKLGADWGAQRVKGLSVWAVLKDVFTKKLGLASRRVETSLIESYFYPKFGPGQFWTVAAQEFQNKGGELRMKHEVTGVNLENNRVVSVDVAHGGQVTTEPCDYFFSTMSLKDLVGMLKGCEIPPRVREIAATLPYRDFITVGLEVKKLKLTNKTPIKTYAGRIPDTWIYIQERDVKVGRLQVFNNWSPYMVNDFQNRIWLGLEYFCNEGDALWSMSDDDFIRMAIDEMVKIGILDAEDVTDSTRIKVKKAYPAYFGSYYQLKEVTSFLDTIENLYCIGRNGQHRYNNMDHSMMTAMEAVDNIRRNRTDKKNIWSVNTEEEYHEQRS